ncbi:hypothetical protein HIM_12648 [Hirsutella minnesotensis 3608]|uniref:Uncharacterized protein n=1 Tax=Hirsutella minnesotensis 3608 TaxID=1043627 RepID=A0A0F7ZQJ3_9HYPO|nr:hypothetical protein HIM_12648 [Hirsutella minnesotensis 3608]
MCACSLASQEPYYSDTEHVQGMDLYWLCIASIDVWHVLRTWFSLRNGQTVCPLVARQGNSPLDDGYAVAEVKGLPGAHIRASGSSQPACSWDQDANWGSRSRVQAPVVTTGSALESFDP